MRVKSYRAHDLATALRRAREEMGSDARVLSHHTVTRELGLSLVELTVAVDPEPPAVEAPKSEFSSLRRLAREVGRRQREASRVEVRSLLRTDLDSELHEDLDRAIGRRDDRSDDPARLAAITAAAIREVVPMRPWFEGPRVTLVVGPPAAGKSTTAAKLIGRQSARATARTHLVQADRFRPGASEQAAVLANTLGARLDVLESPHELAVLRRRLRRERLFVDTTGAGSFERDDRRWNDLLRLRDCAPDAETLLVLPGYLPRELAERYLDRFMQLSPTALGLTSTDVAPGDGVLAAAIARDLPLALTTDGQTIPDDLEPACATTVAALVLARQECSP